MTKSDSNRVLPIVDLDQAVLKRWYEAVPDDREGMDALLDPEVEFRVCAGWPSGGTYHGPRAVLDEYFATAGQAWESLDPEVDEVIEAGEACVVRGRYVGIAAGTGVAFEADFIHVWRLRDGRIVSLDQVADSALLARARNS